MRCPLQLARIGKCRRVTSPRYPLLMAVARCSMAVPRHRPCVITLVYQPEGDITETVFLVGKGVTYDTGTTDVTL